MKEIPLTRGRVAIVNDEDYEWLSQWKWHCSYYGYAVRDSSRLLGKQKLWMHRVILNAPSDMECDHKDHDKLNNQRANLRLCTRTENNCNAQKPHTNTSGYKGVGFHKQTGKWRARIKINRKEKHLGLFADALNAAYAYDDAARELFGDFAFTNFEVNNNVT